MPCKTIKLERTIDLMVLALCADYSRRADAIISRSVSHRTELEYRYYNKKMLDAAMEIVGGSLEGEIFIREIGERIGYARSRINNVSEVTYKRRKREIRTNIAKRLHLID